MSTKNTFGNTDLANSIERWMALNDPRKPKKLFTASPRVTATLKSTAELFGKSEAVVSSAQLTGEEANDVIESSKKLKKSLDEKNDQEGLERFKNQPMDGCTSVMNIARKTSGFDPLKPEIAGNLDKFFDYGKRILDAPFFNLGYSDSKKIHRESKDWNDLIQGVTDLFEGVKGDDIAKIKDGIQNLAIAATSRSSTKQAMNLFVQNVLQADGGTYSVYIYFSSIELQEDKKKGSTSKQSDFNISRIKLIFRSGDWPFFAEKVWKKEVCAVDDWLNGNTTTKGDQPAKLAAFMRQIKRA
jgi:hypothetical protein